MTSENNEQGLPKADFLEEAIRVVNEAEKNVIILRVLGATPLRMSLPPKLGRQAKAPNPRRQRHHASAMV